MILLSSLDLDYVTLPTQANNVCRFRPTMHSATHLVGITLPTQALNGGGVKWRGDLEPEKPKNIATDAQLTSEAVGTVLSFSDKNLLRKMRLNRMIAGMKPAYV
jgi:hypothetical protein